MNILVRNLSRIITQVELQEMFTHHGAVRSVTLVMDKATGESKGFGFVDMPDRNEAAKAIKMLNGKVLRGEKIRVKLSNSRPKK